MGWFSTTKAFVFVYIWCSIGVLSTPDGTFYNQICYPAIFSWSWLLAIYGHIKGSEALRRLYLSCPMLLEYLLSIIGPEVSNLLEIMFIIQNTCHVRICDSLLILSSFPFTCLEFLVKVIKYVSSILRETIWSFTRFLVIFLLVLYLLTRVLNSNDQLVIKMFYVLVIVILVLVKFLSYNKHWFLGILDSFIFFIFHLLGTIVHYGNCISRSLVWGAISSGLPSVLAEESKKKSEKPAVFSDFGPYVFCGLLMVGNLIHRMMPHLERSRPWASLVDSLSWGYPAFVGVTGFVRTMTWLTQSYLGLPT